MAVNISYQGDIFAVNCGAQFSAFSSYNTGIKSENLSLKNSGALDVLKPIGAPFLVDISYTALFNTDFIGAIGAGLIIGYVSAGNDSDIYYPSGNLLEKRILQLSSYYTSFSIVKYFDAYSGFVPFAGINAGAIFSFNNYLEKDTYTDARQLYKTEIDDINGIIPSISAEAGVNYSFDQFDVGIKAGYRLASANIVTGIRSNDYLDNKSNGRFDYNLSGPFIMTGISFRAIKVKKIIINPAEYHETEKTAEVKTEGLTIKSDKTSDLDIVAAVLPEIKNESAATNVTETVKQARLALGFETYKDNRTQAEKNADEMAMQDLTLKMKSAVKQAKAKANSDNLGRKNASPEKPYNQDVEDGVSNTAKNEKTDAPVKINSIVEPIVNNYGNAIPVFGDAKKMIHPPEEIPVIIKPGTFADLSKKGDESFLIEKYDTALGFYLKALKINNNDVTNKKIGNCYYYSGNKTEALKYYKISIKLNPDDAELKEFIDELTN
jgi:tetratricopeptide (TPR) repeat protein